MRGDKWSDWMVGDKEEIVFDFKECGKFRLLAAEGETVNIKCRQKRRVG